MNTLYLGDCLYVLRDNVPDEYIDLVYIDPPFNSKRDYNIFFDDKELHTQRIAFEDTWTLKNIQDSLAELHTLKTDYLYFLLLTYKKVAPHAFPYLTMMALRILELHRVLKPTGSFYLHCDPTMSHYLKTICDIIFDQRNFQNEIVWKRTFNTGSSKSVAKKFAANSDTILYYTKSNEFVFHKLYRPYSEGALKRYDKVDKKGRFMWVPLKTVSKERLTELRKTGEIREEPGLKYPRYKKYFDKDKGPTVDTLWNDIDTMATRGKSERLGYPTQKPKALLERIIHASSNEGDTVLDAFCGCGTTVDAAESLHRNWIGIDISPLAISLIKRRLKDTYLEGLSKFVVRGVPTTENSAKALWKQNPFAFEDWWLTEFEVFATTYGKKGADKGIDGIAQYLVDHKEQKVIRAAFQVKGGKHIQSKDIDALLGTMEKHKCELGVLLTITKPTKPMLDTVAGSGFVEVPGHKYPRLQILTLKEYYQNKQLKLPSVNITFKAAQLKGKKSKGQYKLEM